MKNILVVFTGGTIGSSITAHTINTAAESRFRLLTLYRESYARAAEIHFRHIAPLDILSENLCPNVWEQLLCVIDALPVKELDGIVVTHGTDTLAFTASMLAIYYRNISVPLLLVSSDYPLTDPRANGVQNFNAAVEFICQRGEVGVFVAYRNQLQSVQIHQGHRLASCLQLSSDFMSVQSRPYLEYAEHNFVQMSAPVEWDDNNADLWPLLPQLATGILLLRPYPGLSYATINLTNVKAVLHDLYHSGTACVSEDWGKDYSLLHFMQRCAARGISMYLAPAIKTADVYASTQLMMQQGGVFIWNTSLETAYAQLLLGYGNFQDANKRSRFLQTLFNS